MIITTCQSYSLGRYTPQKGSVWPQVPQMTSQISFLIRSRFLRLPKKAIFKCAQLRQKLIFFDAVFFVRSEMMSTL